MSDSLGTAGAGLWSDGAIWRSFGMLILVLALLLAAVWFLRRIQRSSSAHSLDLEVLGRLPLTPKQSLTVVRVGTDLWVLGTSDNSIQYIGDYHGELPLAAERGPLGSSFRRTFEAKLKSLGRSLAHKRGSEAQTAT